MMLTQQIEEALLQQEQGWEQLPPCLGDNRTTKPYFEQINKYMQFDFISLSIVIHPYGRRESTRLMHKPANVRRGLSHSHATGRRTQLISHSDD